MLFSFLSHSHFTQRFDLYQRRMALETMMYYCKFNQVAIPLATTVPDVSFSAEPVLLVSHLQHTATDFANPTPTPTPIAISQDDEGMLTFARAEKAVDSTARAVQGLSITV